MGYASEAADSIIKYAFQSLKIEKLTARVRINNMKSKKVIEKLGFQFIDDKHYNNRKLSYFELFQENLIKY